MVEDADIAYFILKVCIMILGLVAIGIRINYARSNPVRWARISFIITWLINVVLFAFVSGYFKFFDLHTSESLNAINIWSSSIQLHGVISLLITWYIMRFIRSRGLK